MGLLPSLDDRHRETGGFYEIPHPPRASTLDPAVSDPIPIQSRDIWSRDIWLNRGRTGHRPVQVDQTLLLTRSRYLFRQPLLFQQSAHLPGDGVFRRLRVASE